MASETGVLSSARSLRAKGELHSAVAGILRHQDKSGGKGGKRLQSMEKQLLTELAKDPYRALGVASDSNSAAIKKAYHKLALSYHPDKCKGATPLFQVLQSAYTTLSSPSQKRQLDREQKQQARRASYTSGTSSRTAHGGMGRTGSSGGGTTYTSYSKAYGSHSQKQQQQQQQQRRPFQQANPPPPQRPSTAPPNRNQYGTAGGEAANQKNSYD